MSGTSTSHPTARCSTRARFLPGSLNVWNATTGELLHNPGKPEFPTNAFSPDGTVLAAVNETEIVVYDVATWKEVVRQPLEGAWLRNLVFSPDGRNLVGASDAEANVVVVDTETWEQSAVLTGHRGTAKDVDVSPDSRLIASSDSTGLVRIWNLPPARRCRASRSRTR